MCLQKKLYVMPINESKDIDVPFLSEERIIDAEHVEVEKYYAVLTSPQVTTLVTTSPEIDRVYFH